MRLNNLKNNQGFSLPEVLVSTMLLAVILTSVMVVLVRTMELNEIAANMAEATVAAKNKVTAMENTSFSQVYSTYNNISFAISGLNGRGITYVDNSNPELLTINTVVCWKQSNGRLFGEDADLDGVLDAGEDANGNGKIDSTVEFTTSRYDS
jgi:prepilin-type N-terminal cleavage/methylation domain-containing protein